MKPNLVLICWSVIAPSFSMVSSYEVTLENFGKVYTDAAKRLRQANVNVRFNALTSEPRYKTPFAVSYWLSSKENRFVWGTTFPDHRDESITCLTSKYEFQLARFDKVNLPRIKFVTSPVTELDWLGTQDRILPARFAEFVDGIKRLDEAINERLLKAVSVVEVGNSAVRASFVRSNDAFFVIKVDLEFDLLRSWAIRQQVVTIDCQKIIPTSKQPPTVMTFIATYPEDRDVFIPLTVDRWIGGPEDQKISRFSWKISDVKFGDVEDEEFLLSHYGLPDFVLKGAEQPSLWARIGKYWVACLFLIALLGVATIWAVFRWKQQSSNV